MTENNEHEMHELLAEHLAQLPRVVRQAIASADLEKRLRDLATTEKLHIDQWQKLENEVTLTLLGLQPIESLVENIRINVGVSADVARTLAERTNELVFIPIRQELERELEHPEAKEREVSAIDAARNDALSAANTATEGESQMPSTPEGSAPTVKVSRPTDSTAYRPGETSAARASVVDDPYREPPV